MDGLDAPGNVMLPLTVGRPGSPLRVLCLGAHSDDIEIGCAGTLLRLLHDGHLLDVAWVVAGAAEPRDAEARASARALLKQAKAVRLFLCDLPDSQFPAHYARAKGLFNELRTQFHPDLIFTHQLTDRHQDHRMIAELTWQTWRNHLILEYEIPKYEGDLGQPNLYVPLPRRLASRKTRHLCRHFASQRSKDWFTDSTFDGLMRLRGIECRATSGMAEAFHARKLSI